MNQFCIQPPCTEDQYNRRTYRNQQNRFAALDTTPQLCIGHQFIKPIRNLRRFTETSDQFRLRRTGMINIIFRDRGGKIIYKRPFAVAAERDFFSYSM